jgi:hypothetical protein
MMRIIFTGLLSFAVFFGFMGVPAAKADYPPDGVYCGNSFAVWSFTCTATSTYAKEQPIEFTVYLFQPYQVATGTIQLPWKIVDAHGKTVASPQKKTPSVEARVGWVLWGYTWDQKDNAGRQVPKGAYSIVFPPMPKPFLLMPLTVNIASKHPKEPKPPAQMKRKPER